MATIQSDHSESMLIPFGAWFVLAMALVLAVAIGAFLLLDDSLQGGTASRVVRWVDAETVSCILYPRV